MENSSRRAFLKAAAMTGVCGSVLDVSGGEAMASGTVAAKDTWMGVLVDLTKCNGCRQCEAACQEAARFPIPTKEELLDESVFRERRFLGPQRYTVVNQCRGEAEAADRVPVYVKTNCMHCNDPACVSACLVGALRKRANGAVTYDAWKCMGCRYCMVACPFEIPKYEYGNAWTPQVRKCTFCSDASNPHRGGIPGCVQACPRQCLIYGKRSELLEQAHARIDGHRDVYIDHIYGEHEAGGTSWLYLSGLPFEELGFHSVSPHAPPRLSETIQHGVFKHFIPPVAWCGILGLAMWLTRPEAPHDAKASSKSVKAEGDDKTVSTRHGTRELQGQLV